MRTSALPVNVLRPGFETPGWAYSGGQLKIGYSILIKPALVGPHLGWGTIAVPGDEPSFVVVPGELDERGSQFFDGIEGPHPQQVLLQGSDESLCDAIALVFSQQGGRSFDPQALGLVLEVAGHVVGAMIVTQLQSKRHPGCDSSEAAMHALPHRLQGL